MMPHFPQYLTKALGNNNTPNENLKTMWLKKKDKITPLKKYDNPF